LLESESLLATRDRDLSKSRIELLGFIAAYTGVLFCVLPRLSLWLDEIRDLIGVRSDGFTSVLEYTARKTAAGVPLGYAAQYLSVRLFGWSTFTGRLPAALFSVAACLGLAVLARRLRIQHPLLPLLIFATFPLQLRYALEARPYSQALCLSIWCTIAFFSLVDRPGISRASLYALSIAAGLYTQPYSFFVPVAHLCWIVLARKIVERRRVLMFVCLAVGAAAFAFLPWALYAIEHWQRTAVSEGDRFAFTWKSPLMILKELIGGGYIGTAVTLSAACLGLRFGKLERDEKLFWVFYLAAPVVCAIVADAVFSYFLAIRQMIFVLAPLALLSSLGMDARIQRVLLVGLLAVNTVADYEFFKRPREDWQAASSKLSAEAARGACVIFIPSHTDTIYAYFERGLDARACSARDAHFTGAEVAVGVGRYASAQDYSSVIQRLASDGFAKIDEQAGEPRVEVYRRNR
jgi:hypothetical protein